MSSAAEARVDGARDRAWSRVIIEGVVPEVDGGLFPIKRTVGEEVAVSADIFADGHDAIVATIRHKPAFALQWEEVAMTLLSNDRWTGRFTVQRQGWHEYTIVARIDRYLSWHKELIKKHEAGQQDLNSELLEGAQLVREAAERATPKDAEWLRERARFLAGSESQTVRVRAGLEQDLAELMGKYPDRAGTSHYDRTLRIMVERERARFGAWYEMFPRSATPEPGRHGTFRDVEARLAYVAEMGFDVLYLPPIHPIGRAFRKGPNNTLTPGPHDPGSPWAIGGPEGGHKSIHPELGTFEDFDRLVLKARDMGIEIALDIAFQCSPDHPYVREHPGWFRHRPDGTIKYAENPPKKYQDIYPIDFECADAAALWAELRDVFLFWIGHGVSIFRVDNPHTKPFKFWDWVIQEVWNRHPDAIFLSEAFTRPKVMRRLAKGGYSQSYTYFTWRNSKWELTEYLTELNRSESAEYMRGNLFANTPDINPEFLQVGGRPAFIIRLVLAATLGATYGIYGPVYEQCVGTPLRPGARRISRLGEVPDHSLGPRRSLEPARLHRPGQRDPPREPGPALQRQPPVLRDRQRRDHLLRQVDAGPVEPDLRGRQPRPLPQAIGLAEAASARVAPGLEPVRVVPGPRTDQRRAFPLARADELRGARPQGQPRAHPPGPPQDPDRAGFRLFHVRESKLAGRGPVLILGERR